MRHWKASLFITAYLGALLFGLAAHAMSFLENSHPAMYFIVWDMYSGWTSYESRMHLVGEGESGTYYDLTPPWGSFGPSCGRGRRESRDYHAGHAAQLARNTLEHTEHEPIVRITMVEEAWSKKYNLPDAAWNLSENAPREPYTYFHTLAIYNRSGECLHRDSPWLTAQSMQNVLRNPRLQADMRKGHTFFATSPDRPTDSQVTPVGYSWSD